ncbi:MAG: hypothetical protein ABIM99_03125 [Candidatus Dojkabacteria bacterium]
MDITVINSTYKKAHELKDSLNQILEEFLDEAQYWIELEHSSTDLIILKVSIKANLQQTLDQISGDISGLVSYDIEIEDLSPEFKEPFAQVSQIRPNFERIYEDIERFDSIANNPFIKEVSIEGDDIDKYAQAQSISKVQLEGSLQKDRGNYQQEKIYNLNRIIKIKVISEIN